MNLAKHKTIQAHIHNYVEFIGWAFVPPGEEAKQQRGFVPEVSK